MTLLRSLWLHYIDLLCLRHRGVGLPKTKTPGWILLGLAGVITIVWDGLANAHHAGLIIATGAVVVVYLQHLENVAAFGLIALAIFAIELIELATRIIALYFDTPIPWISGALVLWTATVAVITVRRLQAPRRR